MATHYASVERGNESNPHDEWGETACGLELDDSYLTNRKDWVTCKNCLKSIAKYDRLSSTIQLITVTAKCPRCKKTKQYTNDKPLNYTPHCDTCFVPLFIHKIDIKTLKIKTNE